MLYVIIILSILVLFLLVRLLVLKSEMKRVIREMKDNPEKNQMNCDLEIDVFPLDRKASIGFRPSLLSRVISGIRDYYSPLKNLRVQLKKNKYDSLHLCTSASYGLLKDILILNQARKKRLTTILHFHFGRIPDLAAKNNWEWKLLRYVSRLADKVIVMDEASFNVLKTNGFNSIHYLPNPFADSIVSHIAATQKTVSRTPRKIIFVGHVIAQKGVIEMVDACRSISNIELHVIGSVSPSMKNEMLYHAGADPRWLFFRGILSHDNVISEMLSSSVFLLPSYTEGFPNVILESMACGCSIVSTYVGAIPEMLDVYSERPCGTCVAHKNVEALKNAIEFYLNNPQIATIHGENAVRRVNEVYSITRVWEQLSRIWNE